MHTPLPTKQRHVNHKPTTAAVLPRYMPLPDAAPPSASHSSNNPCDPKETPTTAADRHQAILASLETGTGNGLNVSTAYLRATFGGASAYYSLWLGQPCTSAVVVHLMFTMDSFRSMKVSSDRICFTPENYNVPQLVRIDVMDHHSHSSVISHRIFSLDKSYDRISTPSVVVKTDWCGIGSLRTFGGPMSKRKVAAVGSKTTRIDLYKAISMLPAYSAPGTSFRVVDSGGGQHLRDPSWFVSHLASGHNFSLAVVLHQNTMLCFSWGLNAHGELGLGSTSSLPEPQLITSLPIQVHGEQLGVLAVSCGKHHVALVTTQAKLFTWGNNKYGQLGHGDYTNRLVPQEVHFAFALATLASHQRALRIKHTIFERGGSGTNVTHAACGAFHTLFVTHQQNILTMGYNQAGQLGIGHRLQHLKGWRSCVPIVVETLRDRSVLDVAAGQNHSACVLSNGEVYVWGCGDDGRLGIGTRDCEMQPVVVSSLRAAGVNARSVCCGARHTAIVSDCDLLYVWGANEFGQLGCGDKVPRLKPCLVSFPTFVADGIAGVSLGEFHSACVTHRGDAFIWGLDLSGESVQIDQCSTPRRVLLNEDDEDGDVGNGNGECARKVSCGWAHTNIVTHARPDSVMENGGGTSFESSSHSSHFHRNLESKQSVRRRDEAARWRAHATPWGLPTCLQYDSQRRGGIWKRGKHRTPAPTTRTLVTLPNEKTPLKPPVEDNGHKVMVSAFVAQCVDCALQCVVARRMRRRCQDDDNRYEGTGLRTGGKYKCLRADFALRCVPCRHMASPRACHSMRPRKRDDERCVQYDERHAIVRGIFYQNALQPPPALPPSSTIALRQLAAEANATRSARMRDSQQPPSPSSSSPVKPLNAQFMALRPTRPQSCSSYHRPTPLALSPSPSGLREESQHHQQSRLLPSTISASARASETRAATSCVKWTLRSSRTPTKATMRVTERVMHQPSFSIITALGISSAEPKTPP